MTHTTNYNLSKLDCDMKILMEKIWKQREKQLEKVLLNTNSFIGSIKGIAGITVQEIK